MGYWKIIATGNSDNIPNVVFSGSTPHRTTLAASNNIPAVIANRLNNFGNGAYQVSGNQVIIWTTSGTSSFSAFISPVLSLLRVGGSSTINIRVEEWVGVVDKASNPWDWFDQELGGRPLELPSLPAIATGAGVAAGITGAIIIGFVGLIVVTIVRR